MARKPGVRAKNGYWYSEAGGVSRYFGRVDIISHAEAMSRMWAELAGNASVDRFWGSEQGEATSERTPRRGSSQKSAFAKSFVRSQTHSPPPHQVLSTLTLLVSHLTERYLDWLRRHRSPRLLDESQRLLRRWCKANGEVPATAINGSHLDAFQDALAGEGYAPLYVKKHATTVRTMFNRGVKAGWLPPGFKPFASVEGIRLDPKPLLESDLPIDGEAKALLAHADPFMRDVIAEYHHNGCRTHELIEAKVGDFQAASRTIVLGKHMRSRTQQEPIPKTITLNADAHAILERRCQGRSPDAHILVNGNGNAYDRRDIAQRFATVRQKAGVRSSITIYSFRHLWISDMLMAGVDVLLVARMAGTSVGMIERVYGHFRSQSYQEAQAWLDRERTARGL
jgi:integrase